MDAHSSFAAAGTVLTVAIGLLHVYFLVLEMFLWRKPIGLRTFHMAQEQADATAVLAMNQGLYNGFLAAGLFWGAALLEAPHAFAVRSFFLVCVAVAGVFGAATVGRRILFVQALPALLALLLLAAARP